MEGLIFQEAIKKLKKTTSTKMQKKMQNIYQKMSVYCLYCLSGFPSRLPQGEMSCCHGGKPTFFPLFSSSFSSLGPDIKSCSIKKLNIKSWGFQNTQLKIRYLKKCPKEYKTLYYRIPSFLRTWASKF